MLDGCHAPAVRKPMKAITEKDAALGPLLEGYIESGHINFLIGSGASMPAIKLAGDIEAKINEKLRLGHTDEANLLALSFIEELEEQHVELTLGAETDPTKETFGNYIRFLKTVDQLLFERKNILLPRQATVFTTNYDLFVEHASTHVPSLILSDGFDRTAPLNGNYPLSPERFFDRVYRSGGVFGRQAEMPSVNLIKLHGSLNWKIANGAITSKQGRVKALTDAQKGNPEQVKYSLAQRALILPNLQKFEPSVIDRTYYDLLRMFANALDRENALVIAFGFSFSDEHILDITRRGLRNPTGQLIILAYDEAAAADLSAKFYKQRNVVIVTPEKGSKLGFPRFCSILENVAPLKAKIHDGPSPRD